MFNYLRSEFKYLQTTIIYIHATVINFHIYSKDLLSISQKKSKTYDRIITYAFFKKS